MYVVVHYPGGEKYGFPRGLKLEKLHTADFDWYEWFHEAGVPHTEIMDAINTKRTWFQD